MLKDSVALQGNTKSGDLSLWVCQDEWLLLHYTVIWSIQILIRAVSNSNWIMSLSGKRALYLCMCLCVPDRHLSLHCGNRRKAFWESPRVRRSEHRPPHWRGEHPPSVARYWYCLEEVRGQRSARSAKRLILFSSFSCLYTRYNTQNKAKNLHSSPLPNSLFLSLQRDETKIFTTQVWFTY